MDEDDDETKKKKKRETERRLDAKKTISMMHGAREKGTKECKLN